MLDRALTIDEAALVLRINRRTIQNWIEAGYVRPITYKGKLRGARVLVSELFDCLANRPRTNKHGRRLGRRARSARKGVRAERNRMRMHWYWLYGRSPEEVIRQREVARLRMQRKAKQRKELDHANAG